jgi:hypothetical protein
MARLAFILYVGCVLMFSAFARAENLAMPFTTLSQKTSSAHLTEVAINQTSLDLYIAGWLATPCEAIPEATLTPDIENPQVLVLRLSSPSLTTNCMAKKQDFEKIVNLPVVAQNSGIHFTEKAIYQVKVEGFPFVMNVVGAELLRVPGFMAQ